MNVLSISHVRQYKKNIFENLGHAWFPIHFSARGGGLRSGWGGGRNTGWFHHDNRIEQAGAELCQAQQCLSCQLAWVAYLVVNQLWLELVAWSSSRLESTGWRTVTKYKISLGSATFIQSRLLSHVTHFSFLSNKRFSSEGGSWPLTENSIIIFV